MSKVIKIKQSDIENIVREILEDERPEIDDFETNINPEELGDEPPSMEDIPKDDLTLGQDGEGNYYVFKNAHTSNPEIVAKV